MKKWIVGLLVFLLLLFCVSCSEVKEGKQGQQVISNTETNESNTNTTTEEFEIETTNANETVITTAATKNDNLQEETNQKQVILEENDFKITAVSIEHISYATILNIVIENKSDQELSFAAACNAFSENKINGIKVEEGYFNEDVAAGEMAEEDLYFKFENLLPLGIVEIESMEIGFIVTDENYDEVYRGVVEVDISQLNIV